MIISFVLTVREVELNRLAIFEFHTVVCVDRNLCRFVFTGFTDRRHVISLLLCSVTGKLPFKYDLLHAVKNFVKFQNEIGKVAEGSTIHNPFLTESFRN